MTQYIGVIGYPLKHSLSPEFQQAALDFYKLDIRYEVWETEAGDLSASVNRLRLPQYLGANVTVPYKEKVIRLLDEIDSLASLIGAVNTIVKRGDKLVGLNTDAYGFIQALREDAKYEPRDSRVVILGAGGAARAVGFALVEERIGSLAIICRTLLRAEPLVKSLMQHVGDNKGNTTIITVPWQPLKISEAVKNCQLIVNCTTLGMKHSSQEELSPLMADWIPKNTLVYDLVYNPSETPLLKMAKKAGASILGGLPMLIYQGSAAFELWVGKNAPIDIMFAAANEALGRAEK